jgi:hypothetical protein
MEPTQLPTERNAQNAADPNTIDFFWAFRALNDKVASNQTEANLKFRPQWENMNFTLFMLTFQHSVYDMETLDDFRGMVFNNGVKKTTVYSGDYVHEWDDRPYSSQYVSEVLFQ